VAKCAPRLQKNQLSTARVAPYYYDYVFIKDIRRKTGNNSRAVGEVLCGLQPRAFAAHGRSAAYLAMAQARSESKKPQLGLWFYPVF
jgi:hypothetical protein